MGTSESVHLAQVNIAKMVAPLASPAMSDFVAALSRVNEVADKTPGFVWRYTGGEGDVAYHSPYPDEPLIIFNMSVWESAEALKSFMASRDHGEMMRDRRKWFSRMDRAHYAMWWLPASVIPTPEEGIARLKYLNEHGESDLAFTSYTWPVPKDAGVVRLTLAT